MSKNKKATEHNFSKAELQPLIVEVFANNPTKVFNYKQLAAHLALKSMDNKRNIAQLLVEMKESGELEEISVGRYRALNATSYITGTVELTQRGSAYIVSPDSEEDVFVAFPNLKHALNGDLVKVLVYAKSRRRRPEGEVVEILERRKDTFVGVLQASPQYAFLIPSGKQLPYDIFIPQNKFNGAQNGDKVVVKINDWPEHQKNPVGEVIQVLGKPGDNDTEMNAIMAEFDLPVAFSKEVEKAADRIPNEITDAEREKRRDFRGITTFTIDPQDAKDFDDALSVRTLDDGTYEVGVHIADVSHYVKEGTILDKEAYSRATSVYLVDRTIPMLPEKLSNGLCSLRPNEEKLTFSAVFILNDEAEVLHQWFGRTVIESDRRFTYEEAQAMIEGGDGDYKAEVLLLNDLAKKLRAKRFKHGSIDFDREEVKFYLDDKGRPTGVYFKRSKEANKLIEEFMLLANKKVAERVGFPKNGKAPTFVYRIHDNPMQDKLEEFNKFISRFGYHINLSSRQALTSSMNKLVEQVKDKPEQNMVETLAVRTMAKAVYSIDNIGHYGLAFDYYTHFTSPIRRYPDVMVHRLLQRYLDGKRSVAPIKYEEACTHSSDMEQLAANAERASVKYKQVEYLSDKIGQNFMGTISGVTQWGFYVELNDSKCEGLVSIHELLDDAYEFDETNYRIVGRYHGKIYELGGQVEIKVAKANFVARQLDFALATADDEHLSKTQTNRQIREQRDQRNGEKNVKKFKSKQKFAHASKDKGKPKRRKK
ncbi:MAG: ribonuclease R [Marinifilaceae bacterium]